MFQKTILCLIAFLTFSFLVNAGGNEPNMENDYESVKGDPFNARIYTLKNGLKVYLSKYDNEPRMQTAIAV